MASRNFTKLTIGDAVKTIGGRCFKKLATESAGSTDCTGTWVLNETIVPPTATASFTVAGSSPLIDFSSVTLNSTQLSGLDGILMSYFTLVNVNNRTNTLTFYKDGTSITYQSAGLIGFTAGVTTAVTYHESSEANRTFTITGGDHAQNADLYAWLTANAVKQT